MSLFKATRKLNFKTRSYFKIIKVTKTITILARINDILIEHISEALYYRN